MFKFGILGGGFGIYGYLPAVHKLGFEILLLDRYEKKLIERAELRDFLPSIRFCESEEVLIEASDCLVFARTPILQYHFISQNTKALTSKKHVFLEKPLAINSHHSNELLELLTQNRINFSIAYLFRYTKWYQEISNTVSDNRSFSIKWQIPVVNTEWKNKSSLGGGPLRFYGIHFFPLFFELGVDLSKISVSDDTSSFRIEDLGYSKIKVDGVLVDKNPFFRVNELSTGASIFSASTPLGERSTFGLPDPRIPIIEKYLAQQLFGPSSIDKTILFEKELYSIMNP